MTAKRFWDKQAPGYAAKPIADPAAYESMLEAVRERLRPSDRVLELGCGTGGTALALAPSVASLTATDISTGMIGIARGKLGGAAPSNVVFEARQADEDVEGSPFDLVLAFSLLHLIADLSGLLASVKARLKPGGLFISKTVCLKHRSPLLGLLIRLLTLVGIAPSVARLSHDDLVAAMEAQGFEVLDTTYFDARQMNPYIVARRV